MIMLNIAIIEGCIRQLDYKKPMSVYKSDAKFNKIKLAELKAG